MNYTVIRYTFTLILTFLINIPHADTFCNELQFLNDIKIKNTFNNNQVRYNVEFIHPELRLLQF